MSKTAVAWKPSKEAMATKLACFLGRRERHKQLSSASMHLAAHMYVYYVYYRTSRRCLKFRARSLRSLYHCPSWCPTPSPRSWTGTGKRKRR